MVHKIVLTQVVFKKDKDGNILHNQGEPLIERENTIYDGPLSALEEQARIAELLRKANNKKKRRN